MVIAKNIIAPPPIVARPGTSPTPIQTHGNAHDHILHHTHDHTHEIRKLGMIDYVPD